VDGDEKRERIARARERGICPECGQPLPPPPAPVGTGRHADGLFCGLECLASFHGDYLEQRRDLGIPNDN
jgi:hypothetical protein